MDFSKCISLAMSRTIRKFFELGIATILAKSLETLGISLKNRALSSSKNRKLNVSSRETYMKLELRGANWKSS